MTVPLTLRATKGSPLTHNEVDANFVALRDGDREVLTAGRIYYVATTGSDSDTGLAADEPFLTIQHAINVAVACDLNGYRIIISIADGTYAEELTLPNGIVGGPGLDLITPNSSISIIGNNTTPGNVIVGNPAVPFTAIAVYCKGSGWRISGMRLRTFASGFMITVAEGAGLHTGKLEFASSAGAQTGCIIQAGSALQINDDITISGNNWASFVVNSGGLFSLHSDIVTITDTPAWGTAFLQGSIASQNYFPGPEFSGASTGKQYILQNNSALVTHVDGHGAGTAYIPGSVPGTLEGGSTYDNRDSGRSLLIADTSYYVRGSTSTNPGNNVNNGLANTAAGAWATIQYAVDYITNKIDLGPYRATINVADGTYTETVVLRPPVGGAGANDAFTLNSANLIGNVASLGNVVIVPVANSAFNVRGGGWYVSGFKGTLTGGDVGINLTERLDFLMGAMAFESADATPNIAIVCGAGTVTQHDGADLVLSGAMWGAMLTIENVGRANFNGDLIVNSTPVWLVACVFAQTGSVVSAGFDSITGSATGTRYTAALNAVINTFGGGANYFPGNVAGSTATGGQYV